MLVVDEGAGPVAWAVGWAVPWELHLMNVAVHPRHRRRGHARALIAELVRRHSCDDRSGDGGSSSRGGSDSIGGDGSSGGGDIEAVQLEVRASNAHALQLYRSLGFQQVGLRRQYYRDGEDAVLMTLPLQPPQQQPEPPKSP